MSFELTPLWISMKTAITATILTLIFGVLVARWMAFYQRKIKGFLEGILILPLVLPPTVVGFILLVIFGKNSPIGQFLLKLGVSVIFSWPAAVIAATVVAFPLMYKSVRSSFEQIDPNILDAARTLGASEWKLFWRVVLPLAWPGVASGTILAFARALGEFGATLMIAGNIPGKTETIPVAIYFAVEGGEMTRGLIWVLVIIAISFGFVFALDKWSGRQNGYRRDFGGF